MKPSLSPAIIPDGSYCYTIESIELSSDHYPVIRKKVCPYWTHDGETAYCAFLDERDDVLLADQVKICEVRDDRDFEI